MTFPALSPKSAATDAADMIRLTADTSVIVSALTFPGSKPNRLLELARGAEIELAVSHPTLDEVAAVLTRKFDWPASDIIEARQQLERFANCVTPTERVTAVADDPDDNAALECALAAGSVYIVSGDRHLLQMGSFRGIRILKAAEFLELIDRN